MHEEYVGSAVVLYTWEVSWHVWSSRRGVILEVDCLDDGCSLWGSCWVSTWGCFYWMLVIESNSVNSGTEVLIENVCIKWHVLQTYCFPSNEDCTLKKFDTNIYFCQKCELISYKVIDYKHDVCNSDLFLFNFYTVQSKNLYPNLPVFVSPCN